MTLSIGKDDASRMLEASRALNSCLRRLQRGGDVLKNNQSENKDHQKTNAPSPKRVVSTSDSGSVASEEENNTKDRYALHRLLRQAASACGDRLIASLVKDLVERNCQTQEIDTCLLLFLDMEKQTKIKTSFQWLAIMQRRRLSQKSPESGNDATTTPNDENTELRFDATRALFRCFLTAIAFSIQQEKPDKSAACDNDDIHQKSRKAQKVTEHSSPTSSDTSPTESSTDVSFSHTSPSFDSIESLSSLSRRLSKGILSEIDDIADFAADLVAEHVGKPKTQASVSFQAFQEWLEANGSAVVPWMELLDMKKWVYASGGQKERQIASIKSESEEEEKKSDALDERRTRHEPSVDENNTTPLNFFMIDDNNDDAGEENKSQTLVTFDFTGAIPRDGQHEKQGSFCISITEDNLETLRSLVHRTGLADRSASEVCEILQRNAAKREIAGKEVLSLHRKDFGRCIRELVPHDASRSFTRTEMENFSTYFTSFFGCFVSEQSTADRDVVDVHELAVGFSLLCAGNKSTKLATGFEFLDRDNFGYLHNKNLILFVRSYLTMLVGISLLSSSPDKNAGPSSKKLREMLTAVDSGAKWTFRHFEKAHLASRGTADRVTFEQFARWYTDGGYVVAPWLELLDLKKLLNLLVEDSRRPAKAKAPSSVGGSVRTPNSLSARRRRRSPGSYPQATPADVLFTFPLTKGRSLVVLREDAVYVRSVVESLGLLSLTPEDVWKSLYSVAQAKPPPPSQPWSRSRQRRSGKGKSRDIDQAIFVRSMDEVLTSLKNGDFKLASSTRETLENFFQSFDLEQVDRVSLNQLMGGLSLLCGGKKSTKLAFSFGLFDGRKETREDVTHNSSLNVEDLFIFLRSFLIVMFSCCQQSLDLSAEAVSRYISDTANMVAEDVMRYQWHTRKRDRVDFDDFGEWYNEGGFETAPWLELLDLKKWVLVDGYDKPEQHRQPPRPAKGSGEKKPQPQYGHYCPPPPPEDAVDPSFFGDDADAIMPLDSIDEMDIILMQPSQDKENDGGFGANKVLDTPASPPPRQSSALRFHLVTNEDRGGYKLSVSPGRLRHIRRILTQSGLHQVNGEFACRRILSKATHQKTGQRKGKLVLDRDDFDSAMRDILSSSKANSMSVDTQRVLSDIMAATFSSFDRHGTGTTDAVELACGFTVLCRGKKSDKLEHAFEVLDSSRTGKLSREEVKIYMRSFLTVLLTVTCSKFLDADGNEDGMVHIDGSSCNQDSGGVIKAADAGAEWATNQAFSGTSEEGGQKESLVFDDFADWYTRKGYSCIPWLELLDLRKWVITG